MQASSLAEVVVAAGIAHQDMTGVRPEPYPSKPVGGSELKIRSTPDKDGL
jgi:hypothetical protein